MTVVSNDIYDKSSDNDIAALWNKSREVLKDRLDPQIYTAWIKPLNLVKTEQDISQPAKGESYEVLAPNKFCRDHISKHYAELITSTLEDLIGRQKVTLSVKSSESPAKTIQTQPFSVQPRQKIKIERPLKQPSDDSNLNPKYNFFNFIVGTCNQFAHAASLKVSEQPGTVYNPLFIYGGVGLGKTHLVNAIGNAVRRRGKKVLFISSEYFLNELIHALRTKSMSEFKNRFRSIDVLIIDDIQFISGKESTQEEFFHTFNDLYQKHKQIILTSDKLPQDLVKIEDRLRTRFSSGLLADIQSPDFETRVAILTKKSETSGIELPLDVAQFLAQQINSNVRELEGALNRIEALSSINKCPITLELAQNAMKAVGKSTRREYSTDQIQEAVAAYYRVSPSDLLGKRRTSNIAAARHIAMFLCRTLTARSYPEIGALFGGRDHSTVIHACKLIEEKLINDNAVSQDIDFIKKSFK